MKIFTSCISSQSRKRGSAQCGDCVYIIRLCIQSSLKHSLTCDQHFLTYGILIIPKNDLLLFNCGVEMVVVLEQVSNETTDPRPHSG